MARKTTIRTQVPLSPKGRFGALCTVGPLKMQVDLYHEPWGSAVGDWGGGGLGG